MNYTSIEQSKALIEVGLNPETADMWYGEVYEGFIDENGIYSKKSEPYYFISLIKPSLSNHSINEIRDIPCWSTGALIDLLPNSIRNKCVDYPLLIFCNPTSFDVEYNAKVIAEIGFNRDNLIDALVEMVLWCLENGYIKKGEI